KDRFHQPRRQFVNTSRTHQLPNMEFFQQCDALRRHIRGRARLNRHSSASPHHHRNRSSLHPEPAASSPCLQTAFSARVAVPRSPVSRLKMERDDQFFLSSSLNPHCPLIALTTSRARPSGPFS